MKKRLDEITNTYYKAIFRYCLQLLEQDVYAAEECTQEVFMVLTEKQNELDLGENIRGWLYAAAQRICMDYLKKKKIRMTRIVGSLDDMQDILVDTPFSDVESALDTMTGEEYQLLEDYYTTPYGQRGKLAKSRNMTPVQFSKKLRAIREKLKKHLKGE